MLQPRIDDRCGGFSHVCSLAPWRKPLGWSLHQAAGLAAHRDAAKRQAWRTTPWPQMLRRAQERQALLLCGDAASCPPWGTRTYPWARRGQHPTVQPSGTRKGSKGFGLLASCQGRFCAPGQAGRGMAAACLAWRTRVLAHTRPPMLRMQDGAP
jgi:hypothetical protein